MKGVTFGRWKQHRQQLHEVVNGTEQAKEETKKSSVRLEHYQKFFENGSYERCWESGTEGNYNMVDGQVNNLKSAEGKRFHNTGTSAGAKTVVYDTDHVYVAMCEEYFTWETSSVVAESVKEDYAEAAVEAEMTKNIINYEEPEDWYKMSGLEEIKIAKSRDDYTAVVSNLKIAEEAATLFLTIQDPGDTTTCRFYAYIKEDGEWKEEFKVAGYVGRSGIADAANRVEGDGTSPAGVYSFGMLFGIQDDPGGLQREYKKVDEDDYWDGDRNSDTYNQHVRGSEMPDSWNAAASEHLIDYKYSYNYAAMVNYNVNPTIKGKGSAIFLHCTHPGSLYSAGCISIPESKMIRALRLIDDQAYIVLVRSAEDLLAYC